MLIVKVLPPILIPFLYGSVCLICSMTQLSGAPKPASPPVSGWIQPIVISPPLLEPPLVLVLLLGPVLVLLLLEPLRPELQASSSAPPPTTAAPTPAARNRLRRETPPDGSGVGVD